jgi:hypothetical protein
MSYAIFLDAPRQFSVEARVVRDADIAPKAKRALVSVSCTEGVTEFFCQQKLSTNAPQQHVRKIRNIRNLGV